MVKIDSLGKSHVVADGAFGTLYASEYHTDELPENANEAYPDRVKNIHKSYIDAGAVLIRTNTFAAYRENLDSNLSVEEVRRKGVLLAAKAVEESGKNVIIAGDIGPAPFERGIDNTVEYVEFAETLITSGAEMILFETFPDFDEIRQAVKLIKEKHKDVFIAVSFSVNQYGISSSGRSLAALLRETQQVKEADGVGLNCNIGPAHMLSMLEKIKLPEDKVILAFPNAGYPKLVRNRVFYEDNAEYFAEKASELVGFGINIIGGCCGTTPNHIRCLYGMNPGKAVCVEKKSSELEKKRTVRSSHAFFNGRKNGEKLIAVELVPPVNADDEAIISSAMSLKKLGVDCLTFPDSPSGRTRVDAVLMAKKIADRTGMCVMPHIACRDKNSIAMRAMFMGAYINDIYNFLIVTGDPVPVTERGRVKGVFNFDSVGLMSIAGDINEELLNENPLTYGGAINQNRKNLEVETGRVRKKLEKGAEFFMTQPVFSKEDAERIRYIKEETGARILCGIMPLISRRNALFMKNEISGVDISDEIIDRFPENCSKEDGEKIGVEIAVKAMKMTEEFADGYYYSFPFNRVYLLEKIRNQVEQDEQ